MIERRVADRRQSFDGRSAPRVYTDAEAHPASVADRRALDIAEIAFRAGRRSMQTPIARRIAVARDRQGLRAAR